MPKKIVKADSSQPDAKKLHKLEPGADICSYKRSEMERDILYFQGILGLEACLDPPTKRETLRQHETRIRTNVMRKYEAQLPTAQMIHDAIAQVSMNENSVNSVNSGNLIETASKTESCIDDMYMGNTTTTTTMTRLQATVKRAMDANRDVMAAVRDEYMPSEADLCGRVHEIKSELKRADAQAGRKSNFTEMDDVIKHMILNDPQCPEHIRSLSRQRPSAFDIYGSFLKFKPQFVAIQLRQAKDIEDGRQSRDNSYFSVFTQMPKGREIVRGIQEQAMSENKGKAKRVNFV